MSCDACLGRSVLLLELGRVATEQDRPAIGRGELRALRARCLETGVQAICRCEASYPEGLRALSDPPPVLFVRGCVELVCADYRRAVGIVGTRRPTTTGREAARRIAAGYAQVGGVVVSGLALGIDGAAHDGALSVRGLTIAVLAGGADRATPASHGRLYDRILEQGAIVSELPPGTVPRRWTFPARNRLIAALSGAVLVVEAPEKSGALITVDQANDLGRDVYAVPGSLAAETCAGSNLMLVDGAGAMLSAAQLAEARGMQRTTGSGPVPPGVPQQAIHGALLHGPLSRSELGGVASTLEPAELELLLLDLELGGWIARRADGRYASATGGDH